MQKRATLTLATNQNKHYPNVGIRFAGIVNRMRRDVITCCLQAILLCFLLVVYFPDINAQNANFVWANGMGGTGSDLGHGVAADANGNVYVTGYFAQQGANFNPGGSGGVLTSAGWDDAFVAKYDPTGTFLWAKSMGGTSVDVGYGVAADANDNVYVTGMFYSTGPNFNPGGSGGMLTLAGGIDAFVAKYDAGGTFLWAKSMGGPGEDEGYGVAADANGNVYVTGYFQGSASFNPGGSGGALTSAGGAGDVFVAKYDPTGGFLWAKGMGGTGNDRGQGVAADATGNVYVTGYFQGSANFNPGGSGGAFTSAGDIDVFVARYDSTGTFLWAKRMGGSDGDVGYGVAPDATGNVYVTGYFYSAANFNPGGSGGALTSAGWADAFVAKYNSTGTFLWAKRMGGTGFDYGFGVAADANGSVYVAGHFDQAADFNPGGSGGALTPVGAYDAFIVKFDCGDTPSSYLVVEECGKSYTLNGEVYTTNGTYTQHFSSTAGCDSTVVLDLTFYEIEMPVITIDTFVLGVIGTYTTYQWIKNGVDIPGATDSTYTVTENADYQVRVTNEGGCEGTSDIYEVNNVSVNEVSGSNAQISIYPNPADDFIHIQSPPAINVMLTAVDGRVLYKEKNAKLVPVKQLAQGIYLLQITNSEGELLRVEKIVKQ